MWHGSSVGCKREEMGGDRTSLHFTAVRSSGGDEIYVSVCSCICVYTRVCRSTVTDKCALQGLSSPAKDEIPDLRISSEVLLQAKVSWVDRRCAFNAQHLFLQEKKEQSVLVWCSSFPHFLCAIPRMML